MKQEARTMTLQFTTLRAPAGVVSLQISPQVRFRAKRQQLESL